MSRTAPAPGSRRQQQGRSDSPLLGRPRHRDWRSVRRGRPVRSLRIWVFGRQARKNKAVALSHLRFPHDEIAVFDELPDVDIPPRLGYFSTPETTMPRMKNRCATKKIATGTIRMRNEPASRIPGPFVPPCWRVNVK